MFITPIPIISMFIIEKEVEEKKKNNPVTTRAATLLCYRLSCNVFLYLFMTQLLGQCNS